MRVRMLELNMHGINIVRKFLDSPQLRFLIFVLMGLSVYSCGYAQKKIDDAYLKCQYNYQYEVDTLTHKMTDDRLVLLIGKNVSKCYSYYSMQIDTLFSAPNKDEIIRQQINAAIHSKKDWPHKRMKAYVYKYFSQNKMVITDGLLLQDYVYEDTLNAQNWILSDSVKYILGYRCQYAHCRYHGHDWGAWFAVDVPVSDGPWKLCGLPGLIIEASSENNYHIFKMVGIEYVQKSPIVFSKTYVGNNKFLKTTYNKFLKDQRHFLFGDFALQSQTVGVEIPDISEKVMNRHRFKPLECE